MSHCNREPRDYRLKLRLWNGDVQVVDDPYRFGPLLSDFDLYLHGEGTNYESYNTLGAHIVEWPGLSGVRFAVWAPNAERISVIGSFNNWDPEHHPMHRRETGGLWECFVPGVDQGAVYKYRIVSRANGYTVDKADPVAFFCGRVAEAGIHRLGPFV